MTQRTGLEIAVIGLAGRFPGARNVEQFWENLKGGVESITFFSQDELRESGVDEGLFRDRNYVPAKGYLQDCDYFAAAFFDYSPREANMMDPQVRVLHECIWEALEDAGYPVGPGGGPVGLYIGGSSDPYWYVNVQSTQATPSERFQAMVLNDNHSFSTRLSYKLDLRGPSFTVQTACSSSLVAAHIACRALLGGECDLAVAGGISITFPLKAGYLHEDGMGTSPDGHCRVFDEKANGTLVGDGVGLVVLKRLEDALEDGDRVYAVIKGSVINNDGREKVGFTAPSIIGQANAIRAAHHMAEVEPNSVSYVEAQSTGTPLGDVAAFDALTQAFGTGERGSCALGSVKTNVGHLNHAAGIAGLIKTVLALHHRLLPPSLHFNKPNPHIDFDKSPFYVNTRLAEWKLRGGPLRAGVISSGIGGTNAHVVLEEAPPQAASGGGREWEILPLSAKTQSELEAMTNRLRRHLITNPSLDLSDVAYTLQVGRNSFKYRRTVLASTLSEAIERLASVDAARVQTATGSEGGLAVVFMFPGRQYQHARIGAALYKSEPLFRTEVENCLALLPVELGRQLRAAFNPSLADEISPGQIDQPGVAEPLLFVVEYALAKFMERCGIRPAAAVGDASGEFVAACLAGVFTLPGALLLVSLRGKLIERLSASTMSTASFQAERDFRLGMTGGTVEEFLRAVASLKPNHPAIPIVSSATGDWMTAEEAASPEYWARWLNKTERPADGYRVLLQGDQLKAPVFVEAGPGIMLKEVAEKHQAISTEFSFVNLVRKPGERVPDDAHLLHKLGTLWVSGLDINWSALYAGERRRRVSLPSYPFERQRFAVSNGSTIARPDVERLPNGPPTSHAELENLLTELWREYFGVREVKVDSGFFQLGGDSLTAIGLVSRMNQLPGVELQVSDLLRMQNISALANHILSADGKSHRRHSIRPVGKSDYYPASFVQQAMFLRKSQRYETRFNLGGALEITGRIDAKKLEDAFRKLIDRHEPLRTSLHSLQNQALQKVWSEVEFDLPVSHCDESEALERFKTFVKPFDLSRPPLLKAELLQVADDRFYLLLDMHHAIYDGVSINIMMDDLWGLYGGAERPPVSVHYKDYAVWQHDLFASGGLDRHKQYWRGRLRGIQFTQLPTDRPGAVSGPEFDQAVVAFEPSLAAALFSFCNQHDVTKLSFVLAVLTMALSEETGRDDIAVGLRVSNRFDHKVENMLGCFLEKVVIRAAVVADAPFEQHLSACNDALLEALDHAMYPYEQLLTDLQQDNLAPDGELFNILVNYVPIIHGGARGEVSTRYFSLPRKVASKYHLNLRIRDDGDTITLDAKYRSDLYSEHLIYRLLRGCARIAERVLENHVPTAKQINSGPQKILTMQ
jgi:acyl transferase domain-containing protein